MVLAAHGQSEQVQVTIEWVGGGQTQASVVRPVARLEQLSYYPQLCARAQQLTTEGLTMAAIAARLNAEGYRPPKRRAHFGAQGIQELLQRLGVLTHPTHQRPRAAPGGAADEWGLRSWPTRWRCRTSRCTPGSSGAGSPPDASRSHPPAGSCGPTRPSGSGCGSTIGAH